MPAALRLLLPLTLLFSSSTTLLAERSDPRPNILFIMLDDLGKEWVSCYGAEGIDTPNVDQLAKTGIRFDNFYVMPQCTPTRLSFLTGQYPFRHGWVNHWDVPRWGGGAHYDFDKNPCIARVMKDAGYKTAVAGKWQINDFRVQPEVMSEMGFDDYCMWTGYEAQNPPSGERYWNPYIHTKEGSKTHKDAYGDTVFTDFLIQFMEKHRNEPMFLYFPMCLPHAPFVTTPAEPKAETKMDKHRAMVRYADHLTGKLTKALDELGIREDTIIVWTTDNGTSGGITGTLNGRSVRGGKAKPTEAGVCVPMIVNGPSRVKKGLESKALMTIADFLPTFAAIGQGKPSQKFTYDGKDCSDALLGSSPRSPHDWILSMGGKNQAKLTDQGVENAYVYRDRVIRDERFKLYVDTNRQPARLIDLRNDPDEKNDLIASDDAEVKAALRKLSKPLEEFPERDNDPIYEPLDAQAWDVKVSAKSEVWKK